MTTQFSNEMPPEVKEIVAQHQEAVVIFVDPSDDADTKVAAFVKILDKGSKLATLLADILRNLDAQKRSTIPSAASSSP